MLSAPRAKHSTWTNSVNGSAKWTRLRCCDGGVLVCSCVRRKPTSENRRGMLVQLTAAEWKRQHGTEQLNPCAYLDRMAFTSVARAPSSPAIAVIPPIVH